MFRRVLFEETTPRHKCLCGLLHVRLGAFVVAAVHVGLVMLALIGMIGGTAETNTVVTSTGEHKAAMLLETVIFMILQVAALASLIYGLLKDNLLFLLPYIIVQAMQLIGLVGAFGVVLLGGHLILAFLCVIATILTLFSLYVVILCVRYYKENSNATTNRQPASQQKY